MRKPQQGVFLIEALMGILIFSLGILSLVAIQTSAISAQSDAQYRIEAANLADQILSQIWVNVDRTNAATIQASLATFRHQETGTIAGCDFSGTAAANALVTAWVGTVNSGTTRLPGAGASMQQILVNTTAGNFNRVTVTLCWRASLDAAPRRHSVTTFVN